MFGIWSVFEGVDRRWSVVAWACVVWTIASPLHAQEVACEDLPSPVYGTGGSAAKPLIASFATALAGDDAPLTVVYQAPGACFAIQAFIDSTPLTGTASYWDAEGNELLCTLPVEGVPIGFGYMGNTATFCPGVENAPTGVGDFPGPVTSWNFIVPIASSQQSISAEAVYLVYGFGAESQAAPWTDEAQLIRRSPTSGAQLAVSAASGLPSDRFRGEDARSNGNSVVLVSGSTNPEAAIGFVSGEVADASRAVVRTLAYQHRGQHCGYHPDSSATGFDKINIREGRYWLWAFHRFFARVDDAGSIQDPTVARFVGLVTGEESESDIDSLTLITENGTVPRCAMSVTREGDYTDLQPFNSEAPCGCFFEAIATGTTSCASCEQASDCSADAPVCRRGYCEAR